MLNQLQPTGILARISFYYDQEDGNGGMLEGITQRSGLDKIGLATDSFDQSKWIETGTVITLSGERYKVTKTILKVMETLNGDLNVNTYFTDTQDPLPNNIFINVFVKRV